MAIGLAGVYLAKRQKKTRVANLAEAGNVERG
jgi:hypothetical protein